MREFLPIGALPAWAKLNGVSFHDVEVKQLHGSDGTDKGSAVVATRAKSSESSNEREEQDTPPEVLMVVPKDLILSLDLVHTCAKSDRYLREVLEAAGEFGKTARGSILIFLLLLITHSHNLQREGYGDQKEHIGVSNPWSEYVKFLPSPYTLPTFYTPEEMALLEGTSLKGVSESKMEALLREFEHLRDTTAAIPWCARNWWGEEQSHLSFEDWKLVDAIYRSRALDMPGAGDSMVPCVDMANHASGEGTGALYETDADGNGLLLLRTGQRLQEGEEVTITYGDEKGAAEMIFSYGFLEREVDNARQLFLGLEIPDDDPLKPAKRAVCDEAPGVRLFFVQESSAVEWESPFVWWACVNEEDGLEFRLLQSNDGERELKVFWKEKNIASSQQLLDAIKQDPMWDVLQLRANMMIQERVEAQLAKLQESEAYVEEWKEAGIDGQQVRQPIWDMIMRLREFEGEFFVRAMHGLEDKKTVLLESDTVKAYLDSQAPGAGIAEDFS